MHLKPAVALARVKCKKTKSQSRITGRYVRGTCLHCRDPVHLQVAPLSRDGLMAGRWVSGLRSCQKFPASVCPSRLPLGVPRNPTAPEAIARVSRLDYTQNQTPRLPLLLQEKTSARRPKPGRAFCIAAFMGTSSSAKLAPNPPHSRESATDDRATAYSQATEEPGTEALLFQPPTTTPGWTPSDF